MFLTICENLATNGGGDLIFYTFFTIFRTTFTATTNKNKNVTDVILKCESHEIITYELQPQFTILCSHVMQCKIHQPKQTNFCSRHKFFAKLPFMPTYKPWKWQHCCREMTSYTKLKALSSVLWGKMMITSLI